MAELLAGLAGAAADAALGAAAAAGLASPATDALGAEPPPLPAVLDDEAGLPFVPLDGDCGA